MADSPPQPLAPNWNLFPTATWNDGDLHIESINSAGALDGIGIAAAHDAAT